jgi:hypothetical protein
MFFKQIVDKILICPLKTLRAVLGLYLLIYFLCFLPNVNLFFSNEGIYAPFLIPDIAPPPIGAWIIYLITLGLMLAFTFGFKRRLITPLLLLFFLYHFALSLAVKNCAYDRLIIIFLFLFCFEDLEKDNKWLIKAFQWQISLFYIGAALFKTFMPTWHTGEMLKMTLASNWGTKAAFWLLSLNLPNWFYDISTQTVVVFELICGFLLHSGSLQNYVFVLGFIFHTSIWVFLGIPQFMLLPLSYIVFKPKAQPHFQANN